MQSQNKLKVIVLGDEGYRKCFTEEGFNVVDPDSPTKDSEVDLICFTGGSDVWPGMYGEIPHQFTQTPNRSRDNLEKTVFEKAVTHSIPMVGICRGAQLLTVLNGGKLIQNVTGHTQYHMMTTEEGEMNVSSSHHQMMYPWDVPHLLLAWATDISREYTGRTSTKNNYQHEFPSAAFDKNGLLKEPEVVFYPQTRSLCHQPHPEWMNKRSPYSQYFFKTIKNYLGVAA